MNGAGADDGLCIPVCPAAAVCYCLPDVGQRLCGRGHRSGCGFGGIAPIGPGRVRRRSSLPRPRDSRSTCSTPLAHAKRPTLARGCLRRSTPLPIGMGAELDEALHLAVRLLLQTLLPTERAAYVLREAFDYSYREIADILRIEVPTRGSSSPEPASTLLRRRRTP